MNKDRKNGKETQNEKKRNQQNLHGCKRERERERAREQRKLVLFLMQKIGLMQRKEEI